MRGGRSDPCGSRERVCPHASCLAIGGREMPTRALLVALLLIVGSSLAAAAAGQPSASIGPNGRAAVGECAGSSESPAASAASSPNGSLLPTPEPSTSAASPCPSQP